MKFVAFLDVLGFKEIVLNNNHEDLVSIFKTNIHLNLQIAIASGSYVQAENTQGKKVLADFRKIKINSFVISDSIILWTNSATVLEFVYLIQTLQIFLAGTLVGGIPLRGGVSVGNLSVIGVEYSNDFIVNHKTIIGEGLVNAYKLEGLSDWSGCIIDEKVIKYLDNEVSNACHGNFDLLNDMDMISIKSMIEKKFIVKYDVPYKGDLKKEHHVIDWRPIAPGCTEESIRSFFESHRKKIESEGVIKKIQNTMHFVKFNSK